MYSKRREQLEERHGAPAPPLESGARARRPPRSSSLAPGRDATRTPTPRPTTTPRLARPPRPTPRRAATAVRHRPRRRVAAAAAGASRPPQTGTRRRPRGRPRLLEEGASRTPKIKKRKVAMFLAYVGKGFQGMQRNPGAVTIEDELEKAIVDAGRCRANAGDFQKVGWMRAARTEDRASGSPSGSVSGLRDDAGADPGRSSRRDRPHQQLFRFEARGFGYTRVTGGLSAKTMCDSLFGTSTSSPSPPDFEQACRTGREAEAVDRRGRRRMTRGGPLAAQRGEDLAAAIRRGCL